MIALNPGTGPAVGATAKQAHTNMRQLLRDAKLRCTIRRAPELDYGAGRYAFKVQTNKRRRQHRASIVVQMPGLPLERVRYVLAHKHDAWSYLRLYVDGSSWLWDLAVNCLRHALGLPDVDDKALEVLP